MKKIVSLIFMSFLLVFFVGCSTDSNIEFREDLVQKVSFAENYIKEFNKNSDDLLVISSFVKTRFSEQNSRIEEKLLKQGHKKENFEYYPSGAFRSSNNYNLEEGILFISFYENGNLENIHEKNNNKYSYKSYYKNGALSYESNENAQMNYYENGKIQSVMYNNGYSYFYDVKGRFIEGRYPNGGWSLINYDESNNYEYLNVGVYGNKGIFLSKSNSNREISYILLNSNLNELAYTYYNYDNYNEGLYLDKDFNVVNYNYMYNISNGLDELSKNYKINIDQNDFNNYFNNFNNKIIDLGGFDFLINNQNSNENQTIENQNLGEGR